MKFTWEKQPMKACKNVSAVFLYCFKQMSHGNTGDWTAALVLLFYRCDHRVVQKVSWILNFGMRKLSIISHTISIRVHSHCNIVFFEEIQTHIPNSATAYHTVTWRQCKGVHTTLEGWSRSSIWSFSYWLHHTGEGKPGHWTTQLLHGGHLVEFHWHYGICKINGIIYTFHK